MPRLTPPALPSLSDHGLVLASGAIRAGWTRSRLYRELARCGWTPVVAGVWVEPGRAVDLEVRLRAEQLLCPRLVVSHRAAAGLWLIETLGARAVEPEFIDPAQRWTSKRHAGVGVRVHRTALEASDVTRRRGVAVTSAVRTLVDLLLAGPRDAALVAVESALTYRTVDGVRRAPLTDLATLRAALPAGVGASGCARAREWLGLVDLGAGSPAETVARLVLWDGGLRPETQAEFDTRDGRRVFVDLFLREEGLAVEVEGYAYHGSPEQHRRDVERFNRLEACTEVRSRLRFTASDVFGRPAYVLGRVRAALDQLRLTDSRRPQRPRQPRRGSRRSAPGPPRTPSHPAHPAHPAHPTHPAGPECAGPLALSGLGGPSGPSGLSRPTGLSAPGSSRSSCPSP
jgi:very-short-patch-repair endonuclease